ncbi:hypothetical protein C8Q78DRAFT_547156 [Trametes maxima]|nr:hypothetical protein C8Q78DRAFT_547156 [Trametes maxima]
MQRSVPPANGDSPGSTAVPHLNIDTTGASGASTSQTAPPTSSLLPNARSAANTDPADQLLFAMQRTLNTLGNTFGLLGRQTIGMATLGPAIDAASKLDSLEQVVRAQHSCQEQHIQEVGRQNNNEVQEWIRTQMRPRVDEIIGQVVGEYVGDRVRDQVPEELKTELESYRRRIAEIKIKLANAEALRRNAEIRRGNINEPLRPLYRPLLEGQVPDEAGAGQPSTVFPLHVADVPSLSSAVASQLVREYHIQRERVEGELEGDVDGTTAVEGEDSVNAGTVENGVPLGMAATQRGRGRGQTSGNRGDSGRGSARGGARGGGAGRGNGGGTARTTGDPGVATAREITRVADLNAFMRFIGVSSFCMHLFFYPLCGLRTLYAPSSGLDPCGHCGARRGACTIVGGFLFL